MARIETSIKIFPDKEPAMSCYSYSLSPEQSLIITFIIRPNISGCAPNQK